MLNAKSAAPPSRVVDTLGDAIEIPEHVVQDVEQGHSVLNVALEIHVLMKGLSSNGSPRKLVSTPKRRMIRLAPPRKTGGSTRLHFLPRK